jgi:hypothetical protein
MTGTTAGGNGLAASPARWTWLRRATAACFLGAGAYACIAIGTDAAARAEEPAAATAEAPAPTAP